MEATEFYFFSVPSVSSVVKESLMLFLAEAGLVRYPQERAGPRLLRYENTEAIQQSAPSEESS